MTTTRALVVTGPDQFALQHFDVPEPAADQQQVEVAAIGVNFIDVYQRQGVYPVPTPFVLCSEGAGTTRDGQRVAWAQHLGSGAGLVNVPREALVPVPDGVDLDVAAAVMLQGLTAHYLISSTFPIKAGDVALVHAAAGGVGQLLVQLITARGGRVIATAGTQAKRQKASDLGADTVIDYTADIDLTAAVRDATGGRGVDVVYDGVGKSTFEASLGSLRPRGMVVLFGGASGQVPPFDLQRLNKAGSVFVTRPKLGDYLQDRAELEWRAGEILGAVAGGSLQVEIGGRYALADAAKAYADLEGRRTTGKLLLLP
ncbi:quinone oxidoreductase family protein [Demetria terragena]|uniref:quinone oxidoreductase family protein n=1 Tax=Demetria terragena TaxID=63959 RepID=UPI000380E77E|nr:quinone oxidoreductase [Demetria terragena]